MFFAACGLLVALMLTDFNKYFTQFHLIFFDNNDWILDERVDRLINILPEGFFSDTAFWIGNHPAPLGQKILDGREEWER